MKDKRGFDGYLAPTGHPRPCRIITDNFDGTFTVIRSGWTVPTDEPAHHVYFPDEVDDYRQKRGNRVMRLK